MKKVVFVVCCLCLFVQTLKVEACTTMLVTKGASATGSTFVTHSNDSGYCDPSIVYVPAKDHEKGSVRNVYPSAIAIDELPQYNSFMTPRLAADGRAPGYDIRAAKATIPLGSIPEVEHTYAYIDSDYAVINEHGLMFGECTNESRFESNPQQGKGIFYASELARVALERCRTAREAVVLMGQLVDTYGVYGTGETLLVADGKEGWVFEMALAPSGKGGFWVSQKVPDGEFFVAANQFRIRDVSENNPDQIFNPKLIGELKKVGWAVFDEKTGNLDWLRSMNGVEVFHPYFSTRRVWRAFSLVAPSQNLPSKLEGPFSRAYPFAIKPDNPIALEDLMAIHRDSYQGTSFDMTKGVAAGSYGTPYRAGSHSTLIGSWERSINTRIIGYTWITEYNPNYAAPVAWISLNTPAESVFVPLSVDKMPKGYERVDRNTYDITKPWWIYTQVNEFARDKYSYVIQDIQQAATQSEAKSKKLLQSSKNMSKDEFSQLLRQNAETTAYNWRKLYGSLLVKYNQGKKSTYTTDWYNATDYANGPTKY